MSHKIEIREKIKDLRDKANEAESYISKFDEETKIYFESEIIKLNKMVEENRTLANLWEDALNTIK